MFIYISQKQTLDKHAQMTDALEHNYIDFFSTHPLTPPKAIFIPVANHANNTERLLAYKKPQIIILTGGNNVDLDNFHLKPKLDDLAPQRDRVEKMLFDYARSRHIPLLAICRGFQHTNLLLGGGLTTFLKGHPPEPHACIYQNQDFQINSYHTHGVLKKDLAPSLQAVVFSKDQDIVEAYVEKYFPAPILGVQWHPERPGNDVALFSELYQRFLEKISF